LPIQLREAVRDILFRRQVRKKREVLEDIADSPLSDGKTEALFSIEKDGAADRDAARIWA